MVSSRSELDSCTEPLVTACSASSLFAFTRTSTVCGVPPPPAGFTMTWTVSEAVSAPSFAVSRST